MKGNRCEKFHPPFSDYNYGGSSILNTSGDL